MWTYDYVGEKLQKLDAELTRRAPHRPPLDTRFVRRTPVRPRAMPTSVLGPVALIAGRALHWIGVRLQSWGVPPAVKGDAAWVMAKPDTASSLLPWWKEGC